MNIFKINGCTQFWHIAKYTGHEQITTITMRTAFWLPVGLCKSEHLKLHMAYINYSGICRSKRFAVDIPLWASSTDSYIVISTTLMMTSVDSRYYLTARNFCVCVSVVVVVVWGDIGEITDIIVPREFVKRYIIFRNNVLPNDGLLRTTNAILTRSFSGKWHQRLNRRYFLRLHNPFASLAEHCIIRVMPLPCLG